MGPSYHFLLQAQVIEEGIKKKVLEITCFFARARDVHIDQLYTCLHLSLGRPNTKTMKASGKL